MTKRPPLRGKEQTMKLKRIVSILLTACLLVGILSGCSLLKQKGESEQGRTTPETEPEQSTDAQFSQFEVYAVDIHYTKYAEVNKPLLATESETQIEETEATNPEAEAVPEGAPTAPTQGKTITENAAAQEIGTETVYIVFRNIDNNMIRVDEKSGDETKHWFGKYDALNGINWNEGPEPDAKLLRYLPNGAVLPDEMWHDCTENGFYARSMELNWYLMIDNQVLFSDRSHAVFQLQTYNENGELISILPISVTAREYIYDGKRQEVTWGTDNVEMILDLSGQIEEQNRWNSTITSNADLHTKVKNLENSLAESERLTQMLLIAVGVLGVAVAVLTVLVCVRRRKPASGRKRKDSGAAKGVKAYGSVHNIGRRSAQQDSFDVVECAAGTLAVVADGMGGLSGGDKVSQKIVSSFRADAKRLGAGAGNDVLYQMIGRANQEVNRMLGPAQMYKSGSTLLSVLINNGMMQWATVGDSRIYLYRSGKLLQINREHDYKSELLEHAVNGKMSFSEVERNPQANRLTSFLGMGELKHVDGCQNPVALLPEDRVLLMSDGVYNTLRDSEIEAVIKSAENTEAAAHLLEKRVLEKGVSNQDNFTCVILEI